MNDSTAELFINEENVGVWAYPAHSEADMVRQAVDLVQPFGSMLGSPSAIAIVDDHITVLDAEKPLLYRYQKQDKQWKALPSLQLDTVKEAETLSVQGNLTDKSLLILDDKTVKVTDVEWETHTLDQSSKYHHHSSRSANGGCAKYR